MMITFCYNGFEVGVEFLKSYIYQEDAIIKINKTKNNLTKITEPKKTPPPPPTQKFSAQFLEMIITIPLC